MTRTWRRRLLWLAGFGCLWINVCDDPPLCTSAYVQDVTEDAATVAVITASPAHVTLRVEDGAGKVIEEIEDQVGAGRRRRHALRVSGLQPATDYRYTLAVDGVAEPEGRIRTAPKAGDDRTPVRFAFLGDSGDQPWWVWLQRTPALHWPAHWNWFPTSGPVTRVGGQVAGYRPDFVLHLGDVIYPKGLNAHYRSGFFRPFEAALRDAPFYMVLGNHDVMDADGLQLLANFRPPRSELTGDGRCFSFAWGPVRIIALDCNTDRTRDRFGAEHPSRGYLVSELARSSEPWIIVASHFPMWSASRQRDRAELLLGLLPELQAGAVSLYLSGHDHCYQRFGTPDEGGTVLIVSGGGGKNLYDVRPHPKAAVVRSSYHWCSVATVGRELTVRSHGLDGDDIDSFQLGLPAGEMLARIRAQNPARASRIEALAR